ncbi:MAG: magnesium chelatase [Bacillota bacterium]|nr:magnesium chelatase [Bacillota bacterium]
MKSYLSLARHSGNRDLFKMVELSILATLRGDTLHIHAEGLRGTGKTTVMRSARQILPPIERIKGCLYNCDPKRPHCPVHRQLSPAEIEALGTEKIPMPFLEISHSAKLGTVAGSIDLAKITDPTNPVAAILPGIIPQAHRGIIFIDEINRLADTSPEITDVLLDVMGTKPGRVQIEETGLPLVEIPVQVSVWAASNPDEEPGPLQEIRRQLSDRFDLVMDMGRPTSVETIAAILAQNQGPEEGPDREEWQRLESRQKEWEGMLKAAREVVMPSYLARLLAKMYVEFSLESIRGIEAIQRAALLHCALRRQKEVSLADVQAVTPLALRHRVDLETLTAILRYLEGQKPREAVEASGGQGGGERGALPGKKAGPSPEAGAPLFTGKLERAGALPEQAHLSLCPRENLHLAPPARARRLVDLRPAELLRTQRELERGRAT